MYYNDFVDKKTFISFIDTLYKDDNIFRGIVNNYIDLNHNISIIKSIRILPNDKFDLLKNDTLNYIKDNNINLNINERRSIKDDYIIFDLYISMLSNFNLSFNTNDKIFEYTLNINDIKDYKDIILNRFNTFNFLIDKDIKCFFIKLDSKFITFGYDNIQIGSISLYNKKINSILSKPILSIVKSDLYNCDVKNILLYKEIFEYVTLYEYDYIIYHNFNFNIDKNGILIFTYDGRYVDELLNELDKDFSKYLSMSKYNKIIKYKISNNDSLEIKILVKK